MKVVGLSIYPVKSTRPVPVLRAEVKPRGLAGDRRWMIVDAEGRYLTQRAHPQLATVEVRCTPGGWSLSVGGGAALFVPHEAPEGARRRTVTVWDDRCDADDVGQEASAWFEALLGVPASLVRLARNAKRRIEPRFASPGDEVSFADGFPLLATTTASLAALNAMSAAAVPMDRFRPNVVIDTTEPWCEDEWTAIRIGPVTFRAPKPCARCVVTTIDQETGERTGEPLSTLARIRKRGEKVLFGVNLVPETTGVIAVGDDVTATASGDTTGATGVSAS